MVEEAAWITHAQQEAEFEVRDDLIAAEVSVAGNRDDKSIDEVEADMARRSQCAAIFVTLVLVACSTAGAPNATGGSQATSATRGLAYAEQACASCHAVQAGQDVSPNSGAPAFSVIANTPGMSPTALNAWLHSAHASMPNLIVEPNDRADLVAYLETLQHGSSAS